MAHKEFFKKAADRIEKLDPENRRTLFSAIAGEVRFLESIFSSISEGILVLDSSGSLIFSNSAAERLCSVSFSKNLNRKIAELLPLWEWDRLLLRPDSKGWMRKNSCEIELAYPERRILDLAAMPNGENTVVIVRDVTADRERAASMRECERNDAVQDLAAGLAHEIGNPLNALSLNLQLMAREFRREPDPERRERLLRDVETAQNEIRRIAEINRSFLNAMRPVLPDLKPRSPADPLRNTLSTMKSLIESRRIGVVLDLPNVLPPVALDCDQMEQVFFNLAKNALEAMPDGGTLSIALASDDESVSVSFRDSGAGMDPETLATLFESYRTTKRGGTGLGLMLSRRIVRAHGGDIDVESKKGEGTRFTVRIPRLDKMVRRLA